LRIDPIDGWNYKKSNKVKTMKTPQAILKTVFGYDEFLPLQAQIIANILRKNDTLVVMPTGGGKSLCYQIPALLFEGLTVVISPLIALMNDQVAQLSALDVPAASLNSQLAPGQYRQNVEKIKQQRAKLLYLAPETFLKSNILALLAAVAVDCLAIDEAHCISEWGHDFRLEYRQLVQVRSPFKDAVFVSLTATATKIIWGPCPSYWKRYPTWRRSMPSSVVFIYLAKRSDRH
jgi:ATP-dependent DNA helicase RecQ